MLLLTAYSADELIFFFALPHIHVPVPIYWVCKTNVAVFFLNSLFNVNPTDKETIKQLDKLDTITKFNFFFDVPKHVYTGNLHYTQ